MIGVKRYNKIIKWWNEHKEPDTILTEEIIHMLYI